MRVTSLLFITLIPKNTHRIPVHQYYKNTFTETGKICKNCLLTLHLFNTKNSNQVPVQGTIQIFLQKLVKCARIAH